MPSRLVPRHTKYVGRALCGWGLGVLCVLGCGGATPAPGSTAAALSMGGLRAQYFSDVTLTTLKSTQVDSAVDFDWGTASPLAGLGPSSFSVRWSGMVTPTHSEKYVFYTQSDDGVRLWVDGNLLVDNWTLHCVKEDSGA